VRRVEFSAADRAQLARRGISEEEALRQLDLLRHPPAAVVLDRPCVVGDGVRQLSRAEQQQFEAAGAAAIALGRATKFVPASGAATRMFQDLAVAAAQPQPSTTPAGRRFFDELDNFPFVGELRRLAGVDGAPEDAAAEHRLLRTLLETMRYATLPKGLIAFHALERPHTAFEDQLREGVGYTADHGAESRTHFTVVESARDDFAAVLQAVGPEIERQLGCRLQVSFSEQQASTDTLAIDADGQPFRLTTGELLFRPAGHGALIENLQALGGDIVVIKNIDNVLPPSRVEEVVRWKRILIGVLAELQSFAHDALVRVRGARLGAGEAEVVLDRLDAWFGRRPAGPFERDAERTAFLQSALDRPLRVCGVVRNEGEPGGAPFWVRDAGGAVTCQIVEQAQVDRGRAEQAAIFNASTHFNPVDIVCGVRTVDGRPYDLAAFVDPSAAFLSEKSHEGRPLRALERPGLWNGAMARWNTVCVEVPASTFAPVKTVFDLLRPQHR